MRARRFLVRMLRSRVGARDDMVEGVFLLAFLEGVEGFEEAVFYSAFVELEAVEDFVAAEVSVDDGAECEVGVVVGWRAEEKVAVLHDVGVVEKHAVDELVLDALGTFESPCEGDDAVCEEVFDSVSGIEGVEETVFVGVEFFLAFSFDDVRASCQAVGGGVL